MKNKIISLAILTFVIIFSRCTKDNYDSPTSLLSGTVVYNSSVPVGVRSGATRLELWQYGYALRNKIDVYIDQDGSFSSLVFDGDYKLVRLNGGPWANQTDSISFKVSGNTLVDVPVVPFFSVTGESFLYSAGVVTSSCTVTKLGSLNIENLTLYVGTTNIIDANNNSQSITLNAASLADLSTPKNQTITLNATLMARQNIFARIGVKTTGVAERFYSPVKKILLN